MNPIKPVRRLIADAVKSLEEKRYIDVLDSLEDADRQLAELLEAPEDKHGPLQFVFK